VADFPFPALASLDPAAVATTQAQVAAVLQAAFPGVDLSRGLFRDLALELGGVLYAALDAVAQRVAASVSLAAIAADPAAADPTLAAAVLANYGITPRAATPAAGTAVVVVAQAIPLVIPAGATFTAGGATFATAGAIAVRTSPATVTGASDVVLAPAGANFAFAIPVTATTPGALGMIKAGTTLSLGFALPGLVAASAAGDFTGGGDAETVAQLLARLQAGIAAPTFSGRGNVAALLGQSGPVPGLLGVSVVGAGDPEMLRDQRSIFPVASFGRCDAWVRTATLPAAVPLAKTATYLGPASGGGGLWQFSLAAADAPGFYEVAAIVPALAPPGTPPCPVVADVRGVDTSGGGWAPDVVSPLDAAYTAYQAATIRFVDLRTPTTGLTANASTAPYAVAVTALPGIAALQAFLGGRDVRPAGGDVLVRAAVPCFCTATVAALVPAQALGSVDPAAVAAAVAAAVNVPAFAGTLYLAALAAAALSALPAGAAIGALEFDGRVRQADGTIAFLRDPLARRIDAPANPAALTSSRTVAFFLDPADVVVTLAPLPPPLGT
jgi:hypothetical protein